MATDLRTRLGHVELPNPILTASGCAGSGRELAHYFDVAKLGAIVTKSVMVAPRAGRPTPRMAETPSGMLNSIGLQGPGIDAFLQRDLPWLLSRGARAVVSIVMPSSVLIIDSPSAPAATQARAIATMSVTSGDSFANTGMS